MENDDVVHPVEELRTEGFFQLTHDGFAYAVVAERSAAFPCGKPECANFLGDELCADVGGHNHDAVFKIHTATLGIGQNAVFQYLQEHVEHIGVGFFDFVK